MNKKLRADLHTHTYFSDGGQSPADVVNAAKGRGVDVIAVTDHDNMNGSDEVRFLAKEAGIYAVDGVELSAYDGDVKVHILGYNCKKNEKWNAFYERLVSGAEERTEDILKKLSSCGVKISFEEVLRERKCPSSPIHAMYISAAGAKKGYAASAGEFYMRYLSYNATGFSCIKRPTPEEAATVIKECGGVCSLAHPGRITLDKEGVISLIQRLKKVGLDGIEAVYSGHTTRDTQYYKGLAERFSLLVTGGSDTHYTTGSRRVGDPAFYPDEKLLSALGIE